MKTNLTQWVFSVVLTLSAISFAGQSGGKKFPDGPNPSMTPGAVCRNSTSYRYPEHIKYCSRDVSSGLKRQIIAKYDSQLGFDIRKMPRGDFKIDHLIPLSIGGANDETNLWPQHKSVYAYSDPLESDVANLIAQAKITQAEAIRVIKECKLNLGRCAELGDYLKSLYN
jgi:hypothetical protein